MNPICRFILILSGRAPTTPTPPPDPGADDFTFIDATAFTFLNGDPFEFL
jgi:hypothetical protein